jgi:surface protein
MSFTTLALTLVYDLSTATDPQTLSLTLNSVSGLTIDWNGTISEETFNNTGRTISSPSITGRPSSFTVMIYGNNSTTDNITAFRAFGGVAFLISATFESSIITLTNLSNAFNGASRLTTITNSPPSSVTNMSEMLRGTTIFNGDITGWNTSNVTIMSGMFRLATNFNQDISGWDVSSVTNFDNMFNSARAFNQNISGWALGSGATLNVDAMFGGAIAFNNGGVALAWGSKTNKATIMNNMFNGCTAFNSDISGWDVSNVGQMQSMFQEATNFNQDISGWNVEKVVRFNSMFNGARSFNQDLSNWTFTTSSSLTIDMSFMFQGALDFNNGEEPLDWGDKIVRVTNMSSMFNGASSFNVDISGWNTSNVTNMNGMFRSTNFNQNLRTNGNYWNTSKVTNMADMFRSSTFNGDITNWDVSEVTGGFGLLRMFQSAPNFNQDISAWNVGKNTNFALMFNNATSFNQDILSWNVSNATSMDNMFNGATNFNQSLENWNISKVTAMNDIFNNTSVTNLNYDSTLIGWANLKNATGVNALSLGRNRYYTIAASGARSILTSPPNSWTINDIFLDYTISQATGTFENTTSSSLTLNGTSNASVSYTYVLSDPNEGSFTTSTGTFSNIGGNNYSSTVTYTSPTGYIGSVNANWYFKSTTPTVGIESEIQTINLDITCLHSSTYVLTPQGYISISELKKGDLVLTDDNRQVEITKISKSRMIDPKGGLLYKICKDAIKIAYPPQDILLSYGHSILLEPEKGNLEGEWIMVKDMVEKYSGVIPQPSSEPFDLYHIHLPSFFDDNLVVNGGFVVESMGDHKTIWEELSEGKRKKDPKLRY